MSVDPTLGGQPDSYENLAAALASGTPEVMVDFTIPDTVFANVTAALRAGVHVVVGTTGLTDEQVAGSAPSRTAGPPNALVAPNFAVGADLMMHFAAEASRHMPRPRSSSCTTPASWTPRPAPPSAPPP